MNTVTENEFKRLLLFRSVHLESVRGVLDACTLRQVAPDEAIIHAGRPNRCIYLLLAGRLRVHPHGLHEESVVVLGPGEMVGEMSVIDQQPASASVVAAEPCRILVMEEDILWSLIQSSHEAACNLLYILSSRLRHADQLIMGDVPPGQEFDPCGSVDALTGLRDRKWFDHVLQRQFLRSMTSGEPLSIILIDIDDFRTFNHEHGRAHGDRVLYAIAQNLSSHLRPADIIARYGSDEFVVLLPNFSMSAARGVAERLYREIAKAIPVMPDGKSVPHPTLSMGLTEAATGQLRRSFVSAAHAALERAKAGGGNGIVAG